MVFPPDQFVARSCVLRIMKSASSNMERFNGRGRAAKLSQSFLLLNTVGKKERSRRHGSWAERREGDV